jgi:hypothetical protein
MLETELEGSAGVADNARLRRCFQIVHAITWPWRPPCPAELVSNRVVMQ